MNFVSFDAKKKPKYERKAKTNEQLSIWSFIRIWVLWTEKSDIILSFSQIMQINELYQKNTY